MAKVRKQERQTSAMPAELERFRLADWSRPEDVDGFVPTSGATPEQVAEERFAHLAAKAKVRQTVARDRWRADHEGVEVPVGTRRQTTP